MTKENSKRLYEHYVKVGYTAAAKDLLNKYPELAKANTTKTEENKKSK